MVDLSKHRIPEHDTFYVPDFVTPDEEDYLIRKINESPQQKWKQLSNRRLQLWGGEITSKGVLFAQPMPSFIDTYPDLITRLKATGVFNASPHGAPNHIILNEYLPGQGIMPHEDGPTYHPVVATISLGSHSVFHYYRYKPEGDPAEAPLISPTSTSDKAGRAIDSIPILSVLLERRSLVISTGSMYTSHLHGIQDVEEDTIAVGGIRPPTLADLGVKVANWDMLKGAEIRKVLSSGGALKRGVRYSLTCRDVERVSTVQHLFKR